MQPLPDDLIASSSSSEDEGRQPAGEVEFYDPEADALDEAHVQQQTRQRQSDAMLSCPGCFTTVCLDCQAHAGEPNRFRAMFVLEGNIRVASQPRVIPLEQPRTGKRRRDAEAAQAAVQQQQGPAATPATAGDLFWPFECAVCGTELGMRDGSDVPVYHFLKAIPTG